MWWFPGMYQKYESGDCRGLFFILRVLQQHFNWNFNDQLSSSPSFCKSLLSAFVFGGGESPMQLFLMIWSCTRVRVFVEVLAVLFGHKNTMHRLEWYFHTPTQNNVAPWHFSTLTCTVPNLFGGIEPVVSWGGPLFWITTIRCIYDVYIYIVHVFKYIVSECIHYIQINIHIYIIATLNIYSHYSTSILYYRYIYLYPRVIQFWAVVSYSNAPRSSTNQRKWRLPSVKFGSVWWSFFVAYTQYNLDPIVTINMFTRSHWISIID